MHSHHPFHAAASGFTLIEVLMAVFVLAVALTGVMRMHLTTVRAQQQNAYQTAATQLAADMAGMIRSWRASAGDHPFLFEYRTGDAIAAGGNCFGGASCDPSALRAFGVAQWIAAVQGALPAARVSICRDAAPWNTGADAAAWQCSGGANAGIVIKLGWRAMPANNGRPAGRHGQDAPQLVLDIGEPAA
ncbi:MAG: type pilus modification protein PilV [Herbaspirillum sp.]|jgi:type IV pilus assembly protein PilV|nr:type pilus modification protein PilV [Herbaspirillum sp.]